MYDEALAQRIRQAMVHDAALSDKKMFGGVVFVHRGLMFVGRQPPWLGIGWPATWGMARHGSAQ